MIKKFTSQEFVESRLYEKSCDKNLRGVFGKLVEYEEETLLKIYYSLFYNALKNQSSEDLHDKIKELKSDYFMQLRDNEYKERLGKLINRQEYIKHTQLPIGYMSIDNYMSGVFLHFFKEYVTLDSLWSTLISKQKENYLLVIREKLLELQRQYIYPKDIKSQNIIIHPLTYDIQLVDLDDECTVVTDEYSKYHKGRSDEKYDKFVKSMRS